MPHTGVTVCPRSMYSSRARRAHLARRHRAGGAAGIAAVKGVHQGGSGGTTDPLSTPRAEAARAAHARRRRQAAPPGTQRRLCTATERSSRRAAPISGPRHVQPSEASVCVQAKPSQLRDDMMCSELISAPSRSAAAAALHPVWGPAMSSLLRAPSAHVGHRPLSSLSCVVCLVSSHGAQQPALLPLPC